MIRLVALVLSVSLHLALLLMALYEPRTGGTATAPTPPAKAASAVEVRLIPKEEPTAPMPPLPDGNGNGYTEVSKVICNGRDENYYGIGLIHGPQHGFITEAPEQYPAYKAGIRVLDQVIQIDSLDDRRDYMQITVRRNNKDKVYHIRKDKICFQKVEPKTK